MTTGAMRRFARKAGEDFVYTTFDEGVRDDYGDIAYSAEDDPPTVRGVRSDGSNRVVLLASGEERKVDIAVIVAAPLKDSNGDRVNIQDDMTKRAATLTDGSGRIYKVAGVGHEADNPLGALRLLCMRQANPTRTETPLEVGGFSSGFDEGFDT